MTYQLSQPQKLIDQHLQRCPNALLFCGMGLGKTLGCLHRLNDLFRSADARGALVVAPLRVCNLTWPMEIADWHPWMRVANLRTKAGEAAFIAGKAHVYLINYDSLHELVKLVDQRGGSVPYDVAIFDELTRAKNQGSKRINLYRSRVPRVERQWGLTGTPIPNSWLDLFAQVRLIDDGERLGAGYYEFRGHHFEKEGYAEFGKWVPRPGAPEEIERAIADITLSLRASDWSGLPDAVVEDVDVDFPPELMKQYRAFKRSLVLRLPSGIITPANAAVLTGKLLQFTSGNVYDEDRKVHPIHNLKFEALRKIAHEEDSPLLVACYFQHEQDALRRQFPEARFFEDAKTETQQRQLLADWNAGKIRMLVGHPACLHPSTKVLTEFRGWVRLVDVRKTERVFDGEEFVSHRGCSCSGIREVVDVLGLKATPNHKFLIRNKWEKARDVRDTASLRRETRYVYSGTDHYLVKMLPLRERAEGDSTEREEVKSAEARALRLLHWRNLPPQDEYANLADLDARSRADHKTMLPGFRSLRGCWARHLRGVVGVQKLLSGYVRRLRGQSDVRPHRQQQRIQQEQLPVGHQRAATGKQEQQPDADIQGGNNAPCGILPEDSGFSMRRNLSDEQRNDRRGSDGRLQEIDLPQRPEVSEVFDIVDCGPRNCFLVKNEDGDVFVSHNSIGHGLNLQHGSNVIVWLSLTYNREHYEQMIARLARRGQSAAVRVIRLMVPGTVDDAVATALEVKTRNEERLVRALQLLEAA